MQIEAAKNGNTAERGRLPVGVRIEAVDSATLEKILPLVARYQEFYRATPDPAKNRAHFSQLLGDRERGELFVALTADGSAVGFATIYFPFSSVRAARYCLMNDLFVVEAARGLGVGRALIERCREIAGQRGFASLEWQTDQGNARAQLLYDSTGAAKRAKFVYSLRCGHAGR